MGILMAIIVYLAIWGIPFLAGWWILRRKKSCHFFIFAGAVFLSFIYFSGASALQMMHNDDMPDYIHINEAFMFTAEKNFGLKKLYDWCQAPLADGKTLPFKYCRVWQDEDSAKLGFFITRGNDGALTIKLKAPDKNFQQSAWDDVFERYCLSVWNENCRVVSDKYTWERRFDSSLPFYKRFFGFTILLMCSLTWLFPLAAVACKVQRRWLFGIMWGAVLALYLMNFFNWSKQTPSLQYERCDAQTALAEISKAENQTTLAALLAHDTALLENDKSKTIIDAPMLCSGKFFTANFLCWDLGKSTYLYYSPVDLIKLKLLTGNAQIYQPQENFYLVSYPDFTRASNNIWYRFAAIQTIAGLLWLGMFVMAIKKRCCWEEGKMIATSEINKIIVRQLQQYGLEYEIDLDPNKDNQEVVFCYDENLGQQRIFKQCSEEELTLLFSALIENNALQWDIALEIAKLLPEKGHLIEDKISIDDWDANTFYSCKQMLLAALGCDQKYESEIIKLLDAVPVDARDGLFMACEALNTPAIFCKLMDKFTLWIKADPDYGIGTGEDGYLVKFIALWQKTQDRKSLDDFIAFCRKNWRGWEEK